MHHCSEREPGGAADGLVEPLVVGLVLNAVVEADGEGQEEAGHWY